MNAAKKHRIGPADPEDLADLIGEFRDRPRRNLLALLESRGLDFARFALAAEMSGKPSAWPDKHTQESWHRQLSRVALRHYTHTRTGPDGEARHKAPGHAMICRWALVLGVDPADLWAPDAESAKLRRALSA